MAKATETKLGELHEAVAVALTDVVQNGMTVVNKDGDEVRVQAPPAYLTAAITFLKNNNITADPETNSKLATLREKLAERRTRLTPQELQAAAEDFAASNGSFMQ